MDPDQLQAHLDLQFCLLLSLLFFLFQKKKKIGRRTNPGPTRGYLSRVAISKSRCTLDWLQSLKQFFMKVSYHILVASLTLMALF